MWRLNTDPAILTPGRFYFAPEGTPASPVGSLRGSRNYVAEKGQAFLEWGELDGKTKWDNGAPPIFVPLPRIIGTENCLTAGELDPTGPERHTDFFRTVCIGGRDYRFPTITYVSFSVARHNREFTYYNDVPLYLVDATCEARYEGPSGIPDTTAVIRVTDVPDGSLATNFYLGDNLPPPPPFLECCSGQFPYSFQRTTTVVGKGTFGPDVWTVPLVDLTYTWDNAIGRFVAYHVCGGVTFGFYLRIYQASGCRCDFTLTNLDIGQILYDQISGVVTCPPGVFTIGGEEVYDPGITATFCGNSVTGGTAVNRIRIDFGPMP